MMKIQCIKKIVLIGACFTQIAFGQSGPIQGGAPTK